MGDSEGQLSIGHGPLAKTVRSSASESVGSCTESLLRHPGAKNPDPAAHQLVSEDGSAEPTVLRLLTIRTSGTPITRAGRPACPTITAMAQGDHLVVARPTGSCTTERAKLLVLLISILTVHSPQHLLRDH